MKTVLVNNYYAGITARGVIAQVKSLCDVMEDKGIHVRMLQSPKWLRKLPRQGIIFHAFEQFYVPLLGLFYDVVIYPYNSASVFSVMHRGSLLIVHDFIQNRKKIAGFSKISARLVRWTQAWYRLFPRNVAYITEEVSRQARWIGAFPRSPIFILPNTFYSFKKKIDAHLGESIGDGILLCTGKVPTKDLLGALQMFDRSPVLGSYTVNVLGLGVPGGTEYFKKTAIQANLNVSRFNVLPMISDDELIIQYKKADFVWVHSEREGFGRNIGEGLLARKRVVASKIPPFMKQARHSANVYLYKNGNQVEFDTAIADCLSRTYRGDWTDEQHCILIKNLRVLVAGSFSA